MRANESGEARLRRGCLCDHGDYGRCKVKRMPHTATMLLVSLVLLPVAVVRADALAPVSAEYQDGVGQCEDWLDVALFHEFGPAPPFAQTHKVTVLQVQALLPPEGDCGMTADAAGDDWKITVRNDTGRDLRDVFVVADMPPHTLYDADGSLRVVPPAPDPAYYLNAEKIASCWKAGGTLTFNILGFRVTTNGDPLPPPTFASVGLRSVDGGSNLNIVGNFCAGGQQHCCPTGVPTVSEWGLIVMTLLVLTAGTIVVGRRHRRAAA